MQRFDERHPVFRVFSLDKRFSVSTYRSRDGDFFVFRDNFASNNKDLIRRKIYYVHEKESANRRITSLAFHPTGDFFLLGLKGGHIRMFNTHKMCTEKVIDPWIENRRGEKVNFKGKITDIAFDEDEETFTFFCFGYCIAGCIKKDQTGEYFFFHFKIRPRLSWRPYFNPVKMYY
jgi:hypothetical protein